MTRITDDPVSIIVSRQTYDRLQSLAVPLEDTPDTVIAKLLDMQDKNRPPQPAPRSNTDNYREVDIVVPNPLDPPSLKHTKLLRAEIAGNDMTKPNWNALRQRIIEIALERSDGDLRWLQENCPINAVEGHKVDEGFAHYPAIGFSIQGQDANHAWQSTATLAATLDISVKAWFQWRVRNGAVHPGKRGLLEVS